MWSCSKQHTLVTMNTYIDILLDGLASLNTYPHKRANCKATCMHSHKYNTSTFGHCLVYNVSGRSQIKYLGHVPNEYKHLFDANLYRVDEIECL